MRGATWGENGTIIFATDEASTGLEQVSEDGGATTVLTRPNRERGEVDHVWPAFLPGGQAVLFTIIDAGGIDNAAIAVLDLKTGAQTDTPSRRQRGPLPAERPSGLRRSWIASGGRLRSGAARGRWDACTRRAAASHDAGRRGGFRCGIRRHARLRAGRPSGTGADAGVGRS